MPALGDPQSRLEKAALTDEFKRLVNPGEINFNLPCVIP